MLEEILTWGAIAVAVLATSYVLLRNGAPRR